MRHQNNFEQSPIGESFEKKDVFLLGKCVEWQLLRTPHMAVSPVIRGEIQEELDVYPEELRTASSLYALEYLYKGDIESYEKLTQFQPQERRLEFEQFQELHRWIRFTIPNEEQYEAMQYIMLIHDIGKNPDVVNAVGCTPGRDNHDDVLQHLFSEEFTDVRSQLLPTYANQHLFTEQQRAVIEGVLTLPFNFPGFLQSQCSSAELQNTKRVSTAILMAHITHSILDIAGARGHECPTSSLTLDSPTAERMMDGAYILTAPPTELGFPEGTELNPTERNELYLLCRAQRYGIENIDQLQRRSREYDQLLTQLQISNMLRCVWGDEFVVIQKAFEALPALLKSTLTLQMLGHGQGVGPLYSLDYGPGWIRALAKSPHEHAMRRALAYITQVMTQVDSNALALEIEGRFIRQIDLSQLIALAQSSPFTECSSIHYEYHGDIVIPTPIDARTYHGNDSLFFLYEPQHFDPDYAYQQQLPSIVYRESKRQQHLHEVGFCNHDAFMDALIFSFVEELDDTHQPFELPATADNPHAAEAMYRAEAFQHGFDADHPDPVVRASNRLAIMLPELNPEQIADLPQVLEGDVSPATKTLCVNFLNTLEPANNEMLWCPQVVAITRHIFNKLMDVPVDYGTAITCTLRVLARINSAVQSQVDTTDAYVTKLDTESLIQTITRDWRHLLQHDIAAEKTHPGIARIYLREMPVLTTGETSSVRHLQKLSELNLPKENGLIIAGAGGGDAYMGAFADHLFEGKNSVLISVRGSVKAVHGAIQLPGSNHIFQATPEIELVGTRQTEHLTAARGIQTFVVCMQPGGDLHEDFQRIIHYTGQKPSHIKLIDSGGDLLTTSTLTQARPSRDHRALEAARRLQESLSNLMSHTLVFVPGVDAPPYMDEIVQDTAPYLYDLVPQAPLFQQRATEDGLPSDDAKYFSRMISALYYATHPKTLREQAYSVQPLLIPVNRLIDRKRAWPAFMAVHPQMSKLLIFDTEKLSKRLGIHVL